MASRNAALETSVNNVVVWIHQKYRIDDAIDVLLNTSSSSWYDGSTCDFWDLTLKEDQTEKYIQKMRSMIQIKEHNWNTKKYRRIDKMKQKRKRKR